MLTEKVAEIIGPEVAKLADHLEIAFLFGSVASGYDDDEADKNLVTIGSLGEEDVAKALEPVRGRLEQDVKINAFTREEYIANFLGGKIFIRKSANAPKTFFVGTDDDLWRLYYEA